MESISLINKVIEFLYVAVPKVENVVNVTFPYSWLGIALLNYSCFNFRHEKYLQMTLPFCSHSGSMSLEKIFAIELERILL